MTGIQWVVSEAWMTATQLTTPDFHNLLEGTLGFSFPGVSIPGLEEFLLNVRPSPKPGMELVNMFWEEYFGCKLEFERDRSEEYETNTLKNYKLGSQNNSGFMVGLTVGQSSFNMSVDKSNEGALKKTVCTGLEDLSYTDSSYSDVSQARISYNVYKAVYAVAHALHTFLNCNSTGPSGRLCEMHNSFTNGQVAE